jgi:hypothetical protein
VEEIKSIMSKMDGPFAVATQPPPEWLQNIDDKSLAEMVRELTKINTSK